MSGTANPTFQGDESTTLEVGHPTDESLKRGKVTNATKYGKVFRLLLACASNLAVLCYFVFATVHWRNENLENVDLDWGNGYGLLIVLLALVYGGVLYRFAARHYRGKAFASCSEWFDGLLRKCQSPKRGIAIQACVIVAIVVFLIVDTADSRQRLMSGVGVIALMTLGWAFSKHPCHIDWRPVLSGLILQFLFGLLTIRWAVGRAIFQCLAEKVEGFLDFAKNGARFIYSDRLVDDGVFAFSVLPVIFYISFVIQILYYLGVMQTVILNLGLLLQKVMGTTICESVTCAANIFVGMTESPLVIKPYLNKLTTSELHTVMCSGFATVSGTVLAAYIKFGANPAHLITASLMAAPATLCYSKLFYPETEESSLTSDDIKLEKSTDSSLMDAASKGALAAIPLVSGIIANVVAFVSFVALINALLSWMGVLVGFKGLTFEFILSKAFMPVSWIMGVPWDKCEDVATLIGLKTIVNEFVAYEALGKYKEQGRIFGRTEAIATFAICGFANPGSLGITLGVLTSLAPDKKESITSAIMRAFVAGSAVCFLTASIAGMLITDDYSAFPANVTTAPSSTIA